MPAFLLQKGDKAFCLKYLIRLSVFWELMSFDLHFSLMIKEDWGNLAQNIEG